MMVQPLEREQRQEPQGAADGPQGPWAFNPRETIKAALSARCSVAGDEGALTVNWRPSTELLGLDGGGEGPSEEDDDTVEASCQTPVHHPAPRAPSPPSPLPAQQSGSRAVESSVEVLSKLGEGGMGVVYLAEQSLPRRLIALKRLRDPSQEQRGWLLRELNVTGQLAHPNIIPIYEVREHPTEGLEILMKRVEGHTLLSELTEEPLSQERLRHLLAVLVQVCHALEFAH